VGHDIKDNLRAPGRLVIWHDWLRPITTALGWRRADRSLSRRRGSAWPRRGRSLMLRRRTISGRHRDGGRRGPPVRAAGRRGLRRLSLIHISPSWLGSVVHLRWFVEVSAVERVVLGADRARCYNAPHRQVMRTSIALVASTQFPAVSYTHLRVGLPSPVAVARQREGTTRAPAGRDHLSGASVSAQR